MNAALQPDPTLRDSQRRILVVEDETIIALDISQQLAKLGYEVVGHAVSGEQAVALARDLKPDLVLMDIQLAGDMDGVAAANSISDLLSLPVVFLTAFAEEQTFERAKLTDPFGYVLKPFSERELRVTLAMAFYKHGVEMKLKKQALALQEINQELANQKFALDQHALVSITDVRGIITYCNDQFCQISGYAPTELLGQDHRLLNSGTHPKEFFAEMWRTIARGQVWHGEICNRAKSGLLYWVNATLVPLLGTNGKPHSFISIREDITERRALENRLRQGQKMEAIGRLAGGIAHDFNNILAVILGYSNLLTQETADNAGAQEDVAEVIKAAERAKDIVQQILTFSRQREPKRQVIRLENVLDEAAKFLRASLPAQIKIKLVLANDTPAILADATQIQQVMMNLAANAQHAMEGNTGTLTIQLETFPPDAKFIRAHPEWRAKDCVLLTVADTGHGMDAKQKERIFEPFFTTKPVGKGTGLGLAVVDGIMRSHDGVITVESEIGIGTTFRLYFPAHTQVASAPATVPAAATVPVNLSGGHCEKILLVDDEPALTASLQRLLTRQNYQVSICHYPQEAIRLIKQNPTQFDLVLTDYAMPGMDGLEMARQLHRLWPELRIILVSGFVPDINDEELHAAGIVGILEKPLSMDALTKAIQRAFAKSK